MLFKMSLTCSQKSVHSPPAGFYQKAKTKLEYNTVKLHFMTLDTVKLGNQVCFFGFLVNFLESICNVSKSFELIKFFMFLLW